MKFQSLHRSGMGHAVKREECEARASRTPYSDEVRLVVAVSTESGAKIAITRMTADEARELAARLLRVTHEIDEQSVDAGTRCVRNFSNF